jgi:hypothetical protein
MKRRFFATLTFILALTSLPFDASAQDGTQPGVAPSQYTLPVAQSIPIRIDIEDGLTLDVLSSTGIHIRELSAD